MKVSEFRKLIREEVKKVISEDIGVSLVYSDMGAIRRSLEATGGDKNLINALKQYRGNRDEHAKKIEKLMYLKKQEVLDSLKTLKDTKKTAKSGLNKYSFDKLYNTIEDLVAGRATFVYGL